MIATFQDTTSKIKPIETIYNGYRFRSRLEAKWAVYFDAIGLKYEYEKDGFDLGSDDEQTFGCYLPDFYFPSLKTYCEIKPNQSDPSDVWVIHQHRVSERFRTVVDSPILLLFGYPWDYDGWWYGWDITDSSAGEGCFRVALLEHSKEVVLIIDDRRESRSFGLNCLFESSPHICNLYPHANESIENIKSHMARSKLALKSKQARFEHGESP
jgi:hypothetical protein